MFVIVRSVSLLIQVKCRRTQEKKPTHFCFSDNSYENVRYAYLSGFDKNPSSTLLSTMKCLFKCKNPMVSNPLWVYQHLEMQSSLMTITHFWLHQFDRRISTNNLSIFSVLRCDLTISVWFHVIWMKIYGWFRRGMPHLNRQERVKYRNQLTNWLLLEIIPVL